MQKYDKIVEKGERVKGKEKNNENKLNRGKWKVRFSAVEEDE